MWDFSLYILSEYSDFFVDAAFCISWAGIRAEKADGRAEKEAGRTV